MQYKIRGRLPRYFGVPEPEPVSGRAMRDSPAMATATLASHPRLGGLRQPFESEIFALVEFERWHSLVAFPNSALNW